MMLRFSKRRPVMLAVKVAGALGWVYHARGQ